MARQATPPAFCYWAECLPSCGRRAVTADTPVRERFELGSTEVPNVMQKCGRRISRHLQAAPNGTVTPDGKQQTPPQRAR
jgi:hypothetical protein